jgi:tetratricopeptide (TPR) repeat protein
MSQSITTGAKLLEEALAFARHGDVDSALALLEKTDPNEQVASILFMLLTAKRRHDEALVLIERTLAVVATDLSRSTWTLRHGLLLLELERLEDARKLFLAVLKLKASEDHVKQAQASLLQTIKR